MAAPGRIPKGVPLSVVASGDLDRIKAAGAQLGNKFPRSGPIMVEGEPGDDRTPEPSGEPKPPEPIGPADWFARPKSISEPNPARAPEPTQALEPAQELEPPASPELTQTPEQPQPIPPPEPASEAPPPEPAPVPELTEVLGPPQEVEPTQAAEPPESLESTHAAEQHEPLPASESASERQMWAVLYDDGMSLTTVGERMARSLAEAEHEHGRRVTVRRLDDVETHPRGVEKPARPSRRARGLRVLASAVVGLAIVGLLAAAGWGFVLDSLPYHTPQLRPPGVTLTSLDTSQFGHYPRGVPAVPVLAWRDVSNRPGNLVTRPHQFAATLATLRHDGFHSVSLPMLEAFAHGRRARLPTRPMVLTFDSGLADDWTIVDPILQRYGFTAIVFINPADVAAKSPSYFLTSEELQAMAASGRWNIGAQIPLERRLAVPVGAGATAAAAGRSASRPESVTEWRQRAAKDVATAQDRLQSIVGRPVSAYAWPVTENPTAQTLKAPGVLFRTLRHYFPLVFTRPGTGSADFTTRGPASLPLPRVRITAADSLQTLAIRLQAGIPGSPPGDPLLLPWQAVGGSCKTLRHAVKVTGRRFVLCTPDANGSRWSGYELHLRVAAPASVTAIIQVGVSKYGRVEVAIGRAGVRVEQETGSRWVLLRPGTSLPPPLPGTSPLLGRHARPLTVSLAGHVLTVSAGRAVAPQRFRLKGPAGHGLISLGLAGSAKISSVRYTQLYLSHVPP